MKRRFHFGHIPALAWLGFSRVERVLEKNANLPFPLSSRCFWFAGLSPTRQRSQRNLKQRGRRTRRAALTHAAFQKSFKVLFRACCSNPNPCLHHEPHTAF
jgi:hypothetical protein